MKRIVCFVVFSLFLGTAFAQSTVQHITLCPGDTTHLRANAQYADSFFWYQNGQLIADAHGNVLAVTTTGYYTVQATNKLGCASDTSASVYVEAKYPLAIYDTASVAPGRKVYIEVLNNDLAACSPLNKKTVHVTRYPIHGSIQVNEAGIVEYTANNILGTDMLEYNVQDESGTVTNTAEVNIIINGDCAQVYPNPAVDDIYINVLNPNVNKVRLVNISGQIIYAADIDIKGKKISLNGLPNDVYIVQLFENNYVDCTYKIIKKKN